MKSNSSIRASPGGGSATGRLDVAQHRLEQRQDLERLRPECRVRVVGREELLAQRDAVRCRHRAPPRRSEPRSHHLAEERSVASLASELGASLEIGLAFAGAAELELARADLRMRGDQRRKVIRPLQRLGDLQGLRKLVLDGLVGIDTYAKRVVSQSRTGESRLFPDRLRKLDRRQKLRVGTFELTAAHEHPRELEHRLEVHPVVGAADVDRPLQETFGRGKVGATHCSHAGGEQPACRSRGELLVPHPELLSKDERLLEVVADDLVELEGGRVRRPLEPLRVLLVELRSQLLWHRGVGSFADEQVPEPIRVLARNERPLRADELRPDERRELIVEPRSNGPRGEIVDGASVEHLALDRRPLQHEPKLGVQRVDARLQESVDGWWHGELAVALPGHGDHLLDEERVPARCGRDALARGRVQLPLTEQVVDQDRALVVPERLEQERGRVELSATPVRPRVEQLRPRDAEQEDRRVAREIRDMLDEVDELGLGPLQVVDHGDLRSVGRTRLQQLAERDPRLCRSRGDHAVRLDPERHEHLDERPVGDALAVREAASAEHVRVVCDPFEEVRDEA